MSKTKLLFVSDSPIGKTGLGKITGKLAHNLSANVSDLFDVGVAGYGGTWAKDLPYKLYPFSRIDNYSILDLPKIWNDFAGEEPGIIMMVWNIAWLPWFTYPETLPPGPLRSFLQTTKIKKWAYVPVDSECPNGRLTETERKILYGLDRVLAYTQFGADVIDRTLRRPEGTTPHLPHGTDRDIFYPRSRTEARLQFLHRLKINATGIVGDDFTVVGIVATNTPRKDWPLGLETCGKLVEKGMNIGVWAHTDSMRKHWDIPELAIAFGLKDRLIQSTADLSEEDLAWAYAACDCTLAIGSGEGWGIPITESLAMGIPVIHGDYAGGAELTPVGLRVPPVAYRYDGYYGNKRPVFNAEDWAKKVEQAIRPFEEKRLSRLAPEKYWSECWPKWEQWFREGIDEHKHRTVVEDQRMDGASGTGISGTGGNEEQKDLRNRIVGRKKRNRNS